MKKQPTLERPLVVYPLVVHFATLLAAFVILISIAIRIDSGGPFADERIIPIIARAIDRDASGRLTVVTTPELVDAQAAAPDLWFVAEDDSGESVTFGTVPRHYDSLRGRLSDLSFGQFRARSAPYELAAVVRRETTDIGALTIMGHGELSELSVIVVLASNIVILPIFLLLLLTSVVVTPWTVRRSLSGVARIAREAEAIDTETRGRRLSETHVPREIAPLVGAFNEALRRLDEGYERQIRFVASASHELRTPVAILRSKVETAESDIVRALAPDIHRLAILTEQLLDLERLGRNAHDERIDLAPFVRRLVGDLAPLVIAGGSTIEFQVTRSGTVAGDAGALERVLMNLVQNAVDHGGRHILVRVDGAVVEVEDDGPGIPEEERERVFEPFARLRPRQTGSGLGLHLVREVVARHGGRVEIRDAPKGGTVLRIVLRAARAS